MAGPSTAGVPAGRYGPPPDPARRRLAVVATGALAAVAVGLAVWIGLGVGDAPVTWKDIGFTVQGTTAVDVEFEVQRADPSVPVRCRLEALNQAYGQVGVIVVDIPAAAQDRQRFGATIATSELAVTGGVDTCWVGDED